MFSVGATPLFCSVLGGQAGVLAPHYANLKWPQCYWALLPSGKWPRNSPICCVGMVQLQGQTGHQVSGW